jgi:hypothetical protein
LISLGKPRHEPLEGSAELLRVKQAEQTAERIMAGQAVLQRQKAAQERLLCNRECCHKPRTLTAAQHCAQDDHQHFVEVVPTSIAGPRVFQTFKAGDKLVQHGFPRPL